MPDSKPRRWEQLKDIGEIPAGTILSQADNLSDLVYCEGHVQGYDICILDALPQFFREIKPRRVLVIEIDADAHAIDVLPTSVTWLSREGHDGPAFQAQEGIHKVTFRFEDRDQ